MTKNLNKIFQLRHCNNNVFSHRSPPCLEDLMNNCSVPCVNNILHKDYLNDIHKTQLMLLGKDQSLSNTLSNHIDKASTEFKFEQAMMYRRRIVLFKKFKKNTYISVKSSEMDIDIVSVDVESDMVCFGVLSICHGRDVDGGDVDGRFFLQSNILALKTGKFLGIFLPQYYLGEDIQNIILLTKQIHIINPLQQTLRLNSGGGIDIKYQYPANYLRLVHSAFIKTKKHLKRYLTKKNTSYIQWIELTKLIRLRGVPRKIECFDVSHTMGKHVVRVLYSFQFSMCGEIRLSTFQH